VREELNVGVVRRVEHRTRLIPVVLDGLTSDRLPQALVHLQWVRVKDVSDPEPAVAAIVSTLLGGPSSKPPLGSPPRFLAIDPLPNWGAQESAVLRLLVDEVIEMSIAGTAKTGWLLEWDRIEARAENELDLDLDQLQLSMSRLEHYGGLLNFGHATSSWRPAFILNIGAIADVRRGEDPDFVELYRVVAAAIVNQNARTLPAIAELTALHPIFIELALYGLESEGLLHVVQNFGGDVTATGIHRLLGEKLS
jgi:hypothetical protein